MAVPLSPEDVAEFKDHRDVMKPSACMTRLETHAKWLVGSTSIVAALFGIYATIKVDTTRGAAAGLAAGSMLCMGIAMTFGAIGLLPLRGTKVRWSQLSDLRKRLLEILGTRRAFLVVGSIAISLGLTLAGAIPLASYLSGKPAPRIVATLDDASDTVIKCGAKGTNFQDVDWIQVVVVDLKPEPNRELVSKRIGVGSGESTASADVELKRESVKGALLEVRATGGPSGGGASLNDKVTLAVPGP